MCSGGHGRRPGSSAMVLCSLSFSVDGLPPSAVAASLIGREKGRRRRSWSAWFPLARAVRPQWLPVWMPCSGAMSPGVPCGWCPALCRCGSLIGREKGRGCPALSGSVAYWSPVSGLSAVGVSGEDLPAVSVCRFPVAGRLASFRVLWSGCRRPGFSAVVLWLPAFSMDGSTPSAVAAL